MSHAVRDEHKQAFLRALLLLHTGDKTACSLSEIKGKMKVALSLNQLDEVRRSLLASGYIKNVGEKSDLYVITENGEHTADIVR